MKDFFKDYKFIKYSITISLIILFGVISFNSIIDLYLKRNLLLYKAGVNVDHPKHLKVVNTLQLTDREIPPKNYKELKLKGGEENNGIWTAPFDWSVTAIHSILLPDETVMTFGSYAIAEKEKKDIRENKKIVLSNGLKLERDLGDHQWMHHNVQGGVDFDIWDPKKGVGDDSHTILFKPIVFDAFCAVARVFDLENLFILGGNYKPKMDGKILNKKGMIEYPDNQRATNFFKIGKNEFIKSNELKYSRWYGSIVRTAEDHFIMVGGWDIQSLKETIISEILEKDKSGQYNWRVLKETESYDLFGSDGRDYSDSQNKWYYPRTFLTSTGNVFGISYNLLWTMEKDKDYKISKVGEIPLVEGDVREVLKHENSNDPMDNKELIIKTISSPVGKTNTALMLEKDKIIILGGYQIGGNFASSNHVLEIDVKDQFDPKINKLKNMNYPRANQNAVILPTGEVFVNGGQGGGNSDKDFSVFKPEIYNPSKNTWTSLSPATFRRNYHATSLLLPNGTILTAGGDVWNAEIYYPPYLFEKSWDGKRTVFAKRPEITEIKKTINNRSKVTMKVDDTKEINRITMISTGSATHAQSSELKFANLEFEKINENEVLIKIDQNKNYLQSGTYMIFAINSSNVPSEGKIVYIK